MKKLIAVAALGAILFSISPAVFAGADQEGPVFEPRPVPPSVQTLGQGTQDLSSDEETYRPLNPDVRG